MSGSVNSWWSLLCAVAALNITAWVVSALILRRSPRRAPGALNAARRLQLVFSAVYVFGCAFRSFLPVFDVPRICLFNTWLSSVIVGRSVATIAELCFVAQWAVMLSEISRTTHSLYGKITSRALLPLIAIAEICSWYSVLTTSNIGHVAEESLWGLSAGLLIASLLCLWPVTAAGRRPLLLAAAMAGATYVAYMFLVDVPMYWARYLADEASGRHYLSIAQGMHDASARWVVSHRWEDWKSEVIWMSLYFSVGVWISLSLIHVPTRDTA